MFKLNGGGRGGGGGEFHIKMTVVHFRGENVYIGTTQG